MKGRESLNHQRRGRAIVRMMRVRSYVPILATILVGEVRRAQVIPAIERLGVVFGSRYYRYSFSARQDFHRSGI